jgi:hypothetical protein
MAALSDDLARLISTFHVLTPSFPACSDRAASGFGPSLRRHRSKNSNTSGRARPRESFDSVRGGAASGYLIRHGAYSLGGHRSQRDLGRRDGGFGKTSSCRAGGPRARSRWPTFTAITRDHEGGSTLQKPLITRRCVVNFTRFSGFLAAVPETEIGRRPEQRNTGRLHRS